MKRKKLLTSVAVIATAASLGLVAVSGVPGDRSAPKIETNDAWNSYVEKASPALAFFGPVDQVQDRIKSAVINAPALEEVPAGVTSMGYSIGGWSDKAESYQETALFLWRDSGEAKQLAQLAMKDLSTKYPYTAISDDQRVVAASNAPISKDVLSAGDDVDEESSWVTVNGTGLMNILSGDRAGFKDKARSHFDDLGIDIDDLSVKTTLSSTWTKGGFSGVSCRPGGFGSTYESLQSLSKEQESISSRFRGQEVEDERAAEQSPESEPAPESTPSENSVPGGKEESPESSGTSEEGVSAPAEPSPTPDPEPLTGEEESKLAQLAAMKAVPFAYVEAGQLNTSVPLPSDRLPVVFPSGVDTHVVISPGTFGYEYGDRRSTISGIIGVSIGCVGESIVARVMWPEEVNPGAAQR